jgi:hypothetical protein
MSAPTAPPYNVNNVIVGDAALYIAPKGTPLPPDNSILFDPTNWTGKTLTPGAATSMTLSVTTSAGTQSTAALTPIAALTPTALGAALAGLSNVGTDPSTGLPRVAVTGPTGGPFVVVFASALGAVTLAVTASVGGSPVISGGLWTPPGMTEAGWTFGRSVTTQDITGEEQSTPVARFVSGSTVSISGTVIEASRMNWQVALNAIKSQIAAASGQPGMTVLTLTDDLVHYAVALESKNEFGFATRDYIPDTVQTETLAVAHRRAAAAKGLAVSFNAVCDIKAIVSRAVNSAALP